MFELVAELMALREEAANGADRICDLEQRCLDLQSSLDDAKRQIYQVHILLHC